MAHIVHAVDTTHDVQNDTMVHIAYTICTTHIVRTAHTAHIDAGSDPFWMHFCSIFH